jgi:hypothetical protein
LESWGVSSQYFWIGRGRDALTDEGSLAEIRRDSAIYTRQLSKRLREWVYGQVVPRLARSVAEHEGGTSDEELKKRYRTALTVLFRLMFVAYAENSRLMPLHANGEYTDHALKTVARHLSEEINACADLACSHDQTLRAGSARLLHARNTALCWTVSPNS